MGRKFKITKDFQDKVKDIDRFMRSKGLDEKLILDTEQLAKNKWDLRKGLPVIIKQNKKHKNLKVNPADILLNRALPLSKRELRSLYRRDYW